MNVDAVEVCGSTCRGTEYFGGAVKIPLHAKPFKSRTTKKEVTVTVFLTIEERREQMRNSRLILNGRWPESVYWIGSAGSFP